jgi:hypothetical protein
MPSFRYISRESKVTYKVSREARFIYTSHTTKQWLALREIYIYIYLGRYCGISIKFPNLYSNT